MDATTSQKVQLYVKTQEPGVNSQHASEVMKLSIYIWLCFKAFNKVLFNRMELCTICSMIFFILAYCGRPKDPRGITTVLLKVWGSDDDLGLPEGTEAYLTCDLGQGSNVVNHPSVCQANGTWTFVEEACESNY